MQAFFIAAVVIIIVSILIYGAFFNRAAVVKRKLRNTADKMMATCQNGDVVKLYGKIKYTGAPLISPLSGRKCVYYYILVEELRSGGKSSSWHTIIEEEAGADVVITDGKDYAFIETGMVKSHLIEDRNYTSGLWEDATEQMNNYLANHDSQSTSWLGFNKKMRFKEGILEEGENVAVAGKVHWKRKAETKLNVPVERILIVSRTDENEPVYISDDPEVAEVEQHDNINQL